MEAGSKTEKKEGQADHRKGMDKSESEKSKCDRKNGDNDDFLVVEPRREEARPNWAPAKPREMMRNREPAWACVMTSSCSIKGIRGAKINRPVKFRRNRAAIKKTVPALALKGSGMGHDFSNMV